MANASTAKGTHSRFRTAFSESRSCLQSYYRADGLVKQLRRAATVLLRESPIYVDPPKPDSSVSQPPPGHVFDPPKAAPSQPHFNRRRFRGMIVSIEGGNLDLSRRATDAPGSFGGIGRGSGCARGSGRQ